MEKSVRPVTRPALLFLYAYDCRRLRRSLCGWQLDSEVGRQAAQIGRLEYTLSGDSLFGFANEAVCDRIFQAVRPDV